MLIKNFFSLIFDTVFFFLAALACIFVFFFVSDVLAKDMPSANLFGALSVLAGFVPIYLVYGLIDKFLSK